MCWTTKIVLRLVFSRELCPKLSSCETSNTPRSRFKHKKNLCWIKLNSGDNHYVTSSGPNTTTNKSRKNFWKLNINKMAKILLTYLDISVDHIRSCVIRRLCHRVWHPARLHNLSKDQRVLESSNGTASVSNKTMKH